MAVLAGIFTMLLYYGLRTFESVSFSNFFFQSIWNPSAYQHPQFGIAGMAWSSGMVTIGAMIIATPLGIGAAAYMSEIAPPRVRSFLKPAIEMLAAIPSVVLGFLGITLIGPFLANTFGLSNGLNALNGSILLSVMALPTIVTIAEDAIHAVPDYYKEASYALGANRWETFIRVTLPSCRSGLLAATMLGLGRALGETMTVLMATGNATSVPANFFASVRTITATVAIEMGEVAYGTPHFYSLFACALVLFVITMLVNIGAEELASRWRKRGQ